MVNIEEEYQELLAELGTPLEQEAMPAQDIRYLEDRLPPRLLQFLSDTGHGIYLDGAVTVCKPSELAPVLALIFKGDDDLHHKDCTVVSYGAFGELSIWSQEFGQINISLAEGLIFSQGLAPTLFKTGSVPKAKEKPDPNLVASYAVLSRKDQVDFLDFKGEEMLERCIKEHGKLSLGECYGFFPALALTDMEGPLRNVKNIQRVQVLEHFAILAQLQPFYLANVGKDGVQKVRQIG